MGQSTQLNHKPLHVQTNLEGTKLDGNNATSITIENQKCDNLIYRLTRIVLPPRCVDNTEIGNLYIRRRGNKKAFVRKIKDSEKDCAEMVIGERELEYQRDCLLAEQDALYRVRRCFDEPDQQCKTDYDHDQRDRSRERQRPGKVRFQEPESCYCQCTRSCHMTSSSPRPLIEERCPPSHTRTYRCSAPGKASTVDKSYADDFTNFSGACRSPIPRRRSISVYEIPFVEPNVVDCRPRSSYHRPCHRSRDGDGGNSRDSDRFKILPIDETDQSSHRHHHRRHQHYEQQIVIEQPGHRRRRSSYRHSGTIWIEQRHPGDYM